MALVANSTAAAQANREEIQTALDSGAYQLAEGNYYIDATLDVSNNLYGYGPSSCLTMYQAGASESMLEINAEGVTVRDLKLDGDGDNATSGYQAHGIKVTDEYDHIIMQNLTIENCQGDGICIYGPGGATQPEGIHIKNCRFDGRGRAGISIIGYGAKHICIDGCIIEKGTQPAGTSVSQAAGIYVEPSAAATSEDIRVANSYCVGDIQVKQLDTGVWDGVIVSNNQIESGKIYLERCRNISIMNNVLVEDENSYIHVLDSGSAQSVKRGVIANNSIKTTASSGIKLQSTTSEGEIERDVVVQGNLIDGCTCCGINADMNYAVISGNLIRGGTGATSGVIATGDFLVIHGNYVDGCTNGISTGDGTARGDVLIGTNLLISDVGLLLQGSGGLSRLFVVGNHLANATDETAAISAQTTMTTSYGEANLKPTDGPTDETL